MEEFMSPSDKAALMEIAGPLFAQAKYIDANSVDKDGYQTSRQAQEIMMALERDERRFMSPQVPHYPQQQHHYAPQQHNVVDYGQHQPVPPAPYNIGQNWQYQAISTPVDNGQLEFKFDQTEQQKTNDLLGEISRKLTKLISLLEPKQQPTENVTKLKVTKDPIQEVPRKSRED